MTKHAHSNSIARLAAMLALALLMVACMALCLPRVAFAVTSDDLFAEADNIMQQIDILQTNINEQQDIHDTAVAERDAAKAAAAEAQKRIEEEQKRMEGYQVQLAACANSMYKTGGSSSFLEVILGSSSFDEFLTKWDAITSVSSQGATLVQKAKDAKAAQEAAKADYEKQTALATQKLEEADQARAQIERTQEALREEVEKVKLEAEELKREEERIREAERLAAIAEEQAQRAIEAMQKGQSGSYELSGSGLMTDPLPEGGISSPFGWRDFNGGSFHMGLDLAAPEGTPYVAAADGTVVAATYDGGYNGGAGNWIVIAHGNGFVTKYMHSSQVDVKVGDQVKAGDVIGLVGNTGDSFGAHLHFQVEYNGVAVDPTVFL